MDIFNECSVTVREVDECLVVKIYNADLVVGFGRFHQSRESAASTVRGDILDPNRVTTNFALARSSNTGPSFLQLQPFSKNLQNRAVFWQQN